MLNTIENNEYFMDQDLLNFYIDIKPEIISFINSIIKELMEHEKTNKIELVSAWGTTSIVYGIGSKILKIGSYRRYPSIPYHHRILQPLINRDIIIKKNKIHIEVTEKVHALEIGGMPKKVLEIIKELAEAGLSMHDQSPENFGYLLKENRIHFWNVNFDTSDFLASNIEYNNSHYILPAGQLVLLDLDLLEITNIHKYINYLSSIGFEEEQTEKIYQKYKKI